MYFKYKIKFKMKIKFVRFNDHIDLYVVLKNSKYHHYSITLRPEIRETFSKKIQKNISFHHNF